MSRRILVIPSWYPTTKRPLNGSFFQEQARFLQENAEVDIQVLYGEKRSRPLLVWFWMLIQSWLKPSWPVSKENVPQNPTALCFEVPANRRVPDGLQITLERRLFWKAYSSLVRTGWKPELIHAQSGMDAGIFSQYISQKTKIPFVVVEHQVVVFHSYSRKRARLVLNSYKNAQKLGAVSHAQRRNMLMHEFACSPVVVPNLVDETRFSLSERPATDTFQILTIMYPHPVKGFKTFFQAMEKLKGNGANFKFTIIGKGDSLFEDEIRNLKLSDHGQLIEKIGRKDIPTLFSKFHVYVCSSDFETFGIAPREAMMCGLPVVTTANGGVEDSIRPETGIVVPVRDPVALAKAIMKVKEDFHTYNPANIRNRVVQECGKSVFLEKMKHFYDL